jgi:hypothetical protein
MLAPGYTFGWGENIAYRHHHVLIVSRLATVSPEVKLYREIIAWIY